MKRFVLLALCLALPRCISMAPLESSAPKAAPNYASSAPRALMRASCGGKELRGQGILACEHEATNRYNGFVAVKVPPLKGRVITTGSDWANSLDIEEAGSSWATLEAPGEESVELRVVAATKSKVVIGAKGFLFRRRCGDGVPCSNLGMVISCGGSQIKVYPGDLGACARPQGTNQRILVRGDLKDSKLYVVSEDINFNAIRSPSESEVAKGEMAIEVPKVPLGPLLISLRLLSPPKAAMAATVVVYGYEPNWAPMDAPHARFGPKGRLEAFEAPTGSDFMAVETSKAAKSVETLGSTDSKVGIDPEGIDAACAYAWASDTMDLRTRCSEVRDAKQ